MPSTSIEAHKRLPWKHAPPTIFVTAPTSASTGAKGNAATPSGVSESRVWGCCKDSVCLLEANEFETTTHDEGNTDARGRFRMRLKSSSCHTGRVGADALGGHVPVHDVRRLVKEQPPAAGLAVPAMPVGSPGMNGPEYGLRKDPCEVLLFRKDETAQIFNPHH